MPPNDNAPTECATDGCVEQPRYRGWCTYHYGRWKRTGVADGTPRKPATLPTHRLTALRLSVGLSPAGPTAEQIAAWRDQEQDQEATP